MLFLSANVFANLAKSLQKIFTVSPFSFFIFYVVTGTTFKSLYLFVKMLDFIHCLGRYLVQNRTQVLIFFFLAAIKSQILNYRRGVRIMTDSMQLKKQNSGIKWPSQPGQRGCSIWTRLQPSICWAAQLGNFFWKLRCHLKMFLLLTDTLKCFQRKSFFPAPGGFGST